MRLIKVSSVAVLAAVAAIALVGATSALASTTTELCGNHTSLTCGPGNGAAQIHLVLAAGTVLNLLTPLITVLCLGELWEIDTLGLGDPQDLHTLEKSSTGCGTGSTHINCTLTTEEQPLGSLLKTGLDEGSFTLTSGRLRLQCSNTIDCRYDDEGTLFAMAGQHLLALETPTIELGGKFFCPDETQVDVLLETLTPTYILQ